LDRSQGVVIAGRYRLERKLGAGGMGSVWLAHDQSLDSRCALKLIDEEKARSEEVRVRFEREAKAAAQLRGSHVVDVFDHGESDGTLYIAMEYLQGEDLGARLDRVGKLDPITTYRIVAHVARALVRAHASGIVHRDLKPENIYLVPGDEEEVAKVLDFGIAKHEAYSLQDKATRTGSFLGTPYYVSPEQARGKSTDFRSDLWSLGIIVFQCLTGKPPFESDALGELMGLILYEDLPRMTASNPDLPSTMDAWWERAAARDREQRFQSAKEMVDALGHALGIVRQVSIPSIAPRRITLTDGSGAFVANASGSFTPVQALQLNGVRAALPSFSDPDWMEERVETDAPVSRTRHSAMPMASLARRVTNFAWSLRKAVLTRTGAMAVVNNLRRQPKHNLVLLAIGSGILLGVTLTLIFATPDDAPVAAAPLGSAKLARQPPTPTPPVPLDPPSAQNMSTAKPSSSAPIAPTVTAVPSPKVRTEDSEPKRKAQPPPRKRSAPRAPDYGI